MAEQRIPSNPTEYPRWITLHNQRIMVKDHYHHSAMTGEEYDANAQLVVKEPARPMPPTLETVMAAGYAEIPAKIIVAQEALKFERAVKPYGDNDPAEIADELGQISKDGHENAPPPGTPGGPDDPQGLMPPAHDEEEITAEMLFGKK